MACHTYALRQVAIGGMAGAWQEPVYSKVAPWNMHHVIDLRNALIRSISWSVAAEKYDSPQWGHDHKGMFSTTSKETPRPKLRVTCRNCTPGLPQQAQRESDKVGRDDDKSTGRAGFDDDFRDAGCEGLATDDELGLAALPVRPGTVVMPQLKCVEPRQNRAVPVRHPELQDKAQWLHGCAPSDHRAILPACGSLVELEPRPQNSLPSLFQQSHRTGVSYHPPNFNAKLVH